MNFLAFAFALPQSPEPQATGIAVTALIGSIAAAGATVFVTHCFLAFLRDHAERGEHHRSRIDARIDSVSSFQSRLLDRLTGLAKNIDALENDLKSRIAAIEFRADGVANSLNSRAYHDATDDTPLRIAALEAQVQRNADAALDGYTCLERIRSTLEHRLRLVPSDSLAKSLLAAFDAEATLPTQITAMSHRDGGPLFGSFTASTLDSLDRAFARTTVRDAASRRPDCDCGACPSDRPAPGEGVFAPSAYITFPTCTPDWTGAADERTARPALSE